MSEVVKWAIISPKGIIDIDHLCSSKAAMHRGISDNCSDWEELKREGWKIAKVRIALVDDHG